MNSLHLHWNLKALTPFLPNDFHQGKKNYASSLSLLLYSRSLEIQANRRKNNHI